MPALPGEHRPGVPVSPALVGPAIFPLPIAVMVVPSPAGTEGRVHLEYRVHHAERILDQGIPRLADAVADQFQEPRIHNLLGRKRDGRAGRLVSQLQDTVVGVFIGLGIVGIRGMNADEVAANAGDQ